MAHEVTLKSDADVRVAIIPGVGSVSKGETVLVSNTVVAELDALDQFEESGPLTLGDEVPLPDDWPSEAAWATKADAGG